MKGDFKKLDLRFSMDVTATGEVIALSDETSFVTWCSQQTHDWPNDKITCPVIMKFGGHNGFTFAAPSVRN